MKFQSLTKIKVTDKDNNMHPEFINYLGQVIQELQTNLSDQGYKIPQQTTDIINSLNTAESKTALIYDSDTDELKVNINGTFKTVQTA